MIPIWVCEMSKSGKCMQIESVPVAAGAKGRGRGGHQEWVLAFFWEC